MGIVNLASYKFHFIRVLIIWCKIQVIINPLAYFSPYFPHLSTAPKQVVIILILFLQTVFNNMSGKMLLYHISANCHLRKFFNFCRQNINYD